MLQRHLEAEPQVMKHRLDQLGGGLDRPMEDITHEGIDHFEKLKTKHLKEKRGQRKQPILTDPDVQRSPPAEKSEHPRRGLFSHRRINKRRSSSTMRDSDYH